MQTKCDFAQPRFHPGAFRELFQLQYQWRSSDGSSQQTNPMLRGAHVRVRELRADISGPESVALSTVVTLSAIVPLSDGPSKSESIPDPEPESIPHARPGSAECSRSEHRPAEEGFKRR